VARLEREIAKPAKPGSVSERIKKSRIKKLGKLKVKLRRQAA
jgi:hypothetical protein